MKWDYMLLYTLNLLSTTDVPKVQLFVISVHIIHVFVCYFNTFFVVVEGRGFTITSNQGKVNL